MTHRVAPQPVASLDLLREVKEVQLQHGLRGDDFGRYHGYLTRRLHTLRLQLGLGNGKKQFARREITPAMANDARHLLLLALEAERCWAAAEEHRAKGVEVQSGANAPAPGKPAKGPSLHALQHQQRNRLNKAVKWGEKLVAIVDAVGTEYQKLSARAYAAEIAGRAAQSHNDLAAAKAAFLSSRAHYYSLHGQATQLQWALIIAKVRECDDRVVYCMQRLGEDPSKYNPPFDADKGGRDAAKVMWLDRPVTVFSVKVKELLRAAEEIEVERRAFQAGRDCVATANALPKLLDFFDRAIAAFNDAVSHSEQDIRDQVGDRTQLQLLEHYLRFRLHETTLERLKFLIEVYDRRFRLTAAALEKGGPLPPSWRGPVAAPASPTTQRSQATGGTPNAAATAQQFTLSQAAGPHEIVHLYDQALECLNRISVLPGVDDNAALETKVNDESAICRAGRALYSGEAWAIAENRGRALSYFGQVEKQLQGVRTQEAKTRGRMLLDSARVAFTRLAALPYLSDGAQSEQNDPNSSASASGKGTGRSGMVLADAPKDKFIACKTIIRLPPDFQSVPCKPVFVDIASTFLELPSQSRNAAEPAERTQPGGKTTAASSAAGKAAAPSEAAGKQQQGKGWFAGWGWGKKK